jgi:hypothetical protein
MVHLIALAILGGVVLILDLRLFGVLFSKHSAHYLSRQLSPIFRMSLAAMLVSGVLMVFSEALKCYYNPAFRLKMLCLFLAVSFSVLFQRSEAIGRAETASPVWLKVSGGLSLALWLSVGLAGRAIGLL